MASPPEDPEFRRAVADAEPLAPAKRVVHRPRAVPIAPQRLRDDALETGEELVYLRAGLQREVLRKLRRGHWVVEDELDLHGMNRQVAALSVAEFLRHCRRRGRLCVRIVHGKGLGSRQREPVLKRLLRKWLLREAVLAFSQAPAAQGGSGAVLVLLKA